MRASTKDILQTIRKEKKRFISLSLICMLGVVMLTGLRAACVDLRTTADHFFDEQTLFDLTVQSTLGLTKDDVEALSRVDGVLKVEGSYSETVYTFSGEKQNTALVKQISAEGMNMPYVLEGNLPQKDDEIAVSQNYMNQTKKKLGDLVEIEEQVESSEDSEEKVSDFKEHNFKNTTYRITAVITDPTDINAAEGVASFRSSASCDYVFYVVKEAVDSELYSEIYLLTENTKELICYSKEYEDIVSDVKKSIENSVKEERENARTSAIRSDAQVELDEEKQNAYAEIEDAQTEIDKNKEELTAGRTQLEEALNVLQVYGMSSTKELEAKEAELEEGEKKLLEAQEQLDEEHKKADQEFEKAQKKIDEIEDAVWYIRDRSSLSGYANVKSDSACIEAIGKVFPVIFLLVAVLISLTTITRLVEEERGLIGTYKALGFTDREIHRKYLIFSLGASLLGGIVGDIGGFIVLPEVIFTIFTQMYQFPVFELGFDILYGTGGVLLFVGAILAATLVSCHSQLKHTPAALMRPNAPK